MAHVRRIYSAVLCIAMLAGSTVSVRGDAGAEAASLLSDRCATCHGETGKGDGPGAANLNPKPKNFHDRKWQKSVSDETLAKVIVQGGPAVGLSKSMPDNPDLVDRPDVVNALIKQIRTWGKKR